MKSKVVVVTGGNSGIGKEAARALLRMDAKVVLVCRNREKAERAIAEIANGRAGDVELIVADLLLLEEARKAAAQLRMLAPKIDVLVNNAGTNFPSYGETADGIERTMAVNYFAPFVLTNLLLENLKGAAPSRIVNVASSAHYSGKVDVNNLAKDRRIGLGGLGAYGRSKLALVLFTYELARRLEGSGVVANCLHPGAVRTNIWAHAGMATPFTRLASLFMLSASEGADTVVYLASSPDVMGVTGKYFERRAEKRSARASYDEALAKDLWEASEKMTKLT